MARSAAPYIERNGPMMASASAPASSRTYVFVIPGLAAISIAGLLEVPLGRWLLFGIVIGPVTAIVTTIIMRLLLRGRLWKPESDEDVDEAMAEQEAHELAPRPRRGGYCPRRGRCGRRRGGCCRRGGCLSRRGWPLHAEVHAAHMGAPEAARSLPLGVLLLPILVPLLMIAFGAFASSSSSPTHSSRSSATPTLRSSSACWAPT